MQLPDGNVAKKVFSQKDLGRKEKSMLRFLFCIKIHCMLVCFKIYLCQSAGVVFTSTLA